MTRFMLPTSQKSLKITYLVTDEIEFHQPQYAQHKPCKDIEPALDFTDSTCSMIQIIFT